LEKPRSILTLEQMGFSGTNLERFRELIDKPYGMIVVTGPTGSGKSTTLYSGLRMLNALEKSIVTVEDPIEYRIPLVKQTQVNQKAGFTFATALRAILRHDPDVILLGEMRDKETAEIGMKAAMTGHLLFTTLHANTSSAAIPRLIDMGIEPFVVASSVLAVIGQRLVRRICAHCKQEYRPDDVEFPSWYGDGPRDVPFFKGTGCEVCRDTGFKGRTAVYELLEVTPEVSAAVARRITPAELERVAQIRDMRADALDKVRAGVTTLAEVQRVLG
jgi:type II secretory ATPase GspE/PulE/Tfp pilus assembly ATPase PilB-like protein